MLHPCSYRTGVAVLALLVASAAATAEPAASTLPSLAPLVQLVMPAVVGISVDQKSLDVTDGSDEDDNDIAPDLQRWSPQGTPFDDLLRRSVDVPHGQLGLPDLLQPRQHEVALGSGFIIDPSGLVVTNDHVVDGGKTITVALQDGRKLVARLLGRDAKTDLALLKIDAAAPLPFVSWGDSGTLQPGDWVVAVGSASGLGGTVSAGIVSARGRDIDDGPYDDFLQIDAPINRGNSGGPSFGLDGRVIGINTAIYTPNGGSVGVAFAIPSNRAQSIVTQLREHGKVSRGWLGVDIQAVTPSIARALGLPDAHGALVNEVEKDSPAAKAGIREGDVIQAFNGHTVDRMHALPMAVADTPVGSDAKVRLWRHGVAMTLGVHLVEQTTDLEAVVPSGNSAAGAFGIGLGPLTPELRQRLELPSQLQGAVIRSISKSSPLNDLELEPNDVILSVNQHPVTTPAEAERLLEQAAAAPHKHVLLLINRNGENEYLAWSEQNQG